MATAKYKNKENRALRKMGGWTDGEKGGPFKTG